MMRYKDAIAVFAGCGFRQSGLAIENKPRQFDQPRERLEATCSERGQVTRASVRVYHTWRSPNRHFIDFILRATILLLCCQEISSCGRKEVPSCGGDEVTNLVADVLLRSKLSRWMTSGWHNEGEVNPPMEYFSFVEVDPSYLTKAFKFQFSNARSRSYAPDIRKRLCTVDITGAFDNEAVLDNIVITDKAIARSYEDESIEFDQEYKKASLRLAVTPELKALWAKNAVGEIQGAVTWDQPQNYSVQLLDNGKLYVMLGE